MKFRFLLWLLAKKLISTGRKNAAFQKELSRRDLIFQLKTIDGRHSRYFIVNRGNLSTGTEKPDSRPSFTIIFRDPDYGFSVLTARRKNAFVTGVLEENIIIEGDFTLIIWFQNLISLMKSGTADIPDHMQRIGFVGTGLIGAPMAIDLSKDEKYDVTVADCNDGALNNVKAKCPEVSIIRKDLSNPEDVSDLVYNYDLVINAVPGYMGFETAKAIIHAGKNSTCIAFYEQDPFELDQLAKEKNVTMIMN